MAKATTSLKAFRAKKVLTQRQQDDSRHQMMKRVSNIARRVADCAEGNLEMTAAQLKAAEMLFNRTVPVLSAVQIVSDQEAEGLTREEIETRIREKLDNNPMLGILAGITPNIIEGKAEKTEDAED